MMLEATVALTKPPDMFDRDFEWEELTRPGSYCSAAPASATH